MSARYQRLDNHVREAGNASSVASASSIVSNALLVVVIILLGIVLAYVVSIDRRDANPSRPGCTGEQVICECVYNNTDVICLPDGSSSGSEGDGSNIDAFDVCFDAVETALTNYRPGNSTPVPCTTVPCTAVDCNSVPCTFGDESTLYTDMTNAINSVLGDAMNNLYNNITTTNMQVLGNATSVIVNQLTLAFNRLASNVSASCNACAANSRGGNCTAGGNGTLGFTPSEENILFLEILDLVNRTLGPIASSCSNITNNNYYYGNSTAPTCVPCATVKPTPTPCPLHATDAPTAPPIECVTDCSLSCSGANQSSAYNPETGARTPPVSSPGSSSSNLISLAGPSSSPTVVTVMCDMQDPACFTYLRDSHPSLVQFAQNHSNSVRYIVRPLRIVDYLPKHNDTVAITPTSIESLLLGIGARCARSVGQFPAFLTSYVTLANHLFGSAPLTSMPSDTQNTDYWFEDRVANMVHNNPLYQDCVHKFSYSQQIHSDTLQSTINNGIGLVNGTAWAVFVDGFAVCNSTYAAQHAKIRDLIDSVMTHHDPSDGVKYFKSWTCAKPSKP